MRAVVVLLVLACGCTQTQARKAHRVGEIATAGGLLGVLAFGVAASLLPAHDDAIIRGGFAFVPISLIGALLYVATDEKARAETAPVVSTRERHRAAALQLTRQAADAARMEDCTQVQAIAPRVRDLDGDFHLSVFMRDAAIQRCLRTPGGGS
jgi:hypothetical protein